MLYEKHKQNEQDVIHPYAIAHQSDILFKDTLHINSSSMQQRLLLPF